MFAIPEQFTTNAKAGIEAQFAAFNALSSKAFEGMEKLVELNLNLTRNALEESSQATRQLLSAKDPQEVFTINHFKPMADKVLAYSREAAAIANKTQSEFSKTAEAQITEINRKTVELVEEFSKHAPAGTEGAVTALKTLIGNANAGYEQFSKASKQTLETLESNLSQVMSQFTQAAEKAAPRAKKAA
ncbi:phasin family protein [Massilia sp. W12]|uniref:phasin family protein n=1 Tax=Massilia sp. W12 TaxID=3126507 RepID=UPI0030CD51FF